MQCVASAFNPGGGPARPAKPFFLEFLDVIDRGSRRGRLCEKAQAVPVAAANWRPRLCSLSDVFVAGAAQVMFNAHAFVGPARRVVATLRPDDTMAVQARVPHAILSRNEYGVGYYHFLFDTLASLAFLWPSIRDDRTSSLVVNQCSAGRDHLANGLRSVAPDMMNQSYCTPRSYVTALLQALGVPRGRVLHWPYTRQLSGPVLGATRATFMCAHPWHPIYHRSFWYVRQLRMLLHRAFNLPQRDLPNAHLLSTRRLVLLVNRRGCTGGCNPTRNVRGSRELLLRLRTALNDKLVREFSGSEPIADQARLFNRAALIIGPHGAAFANTVWCAAGTAVVEFHRMKFREANSPLYVLLSRLLMLRHWVVVDTQSDARHRGYLVASDVVIATARAALGDARSVNESNKSAFYLPNWITTS